MNYLRKIIREQLSNYNDLKQIVKTHRGEIYEYQDKILKVTTDIIEFQNAKILIKNPSKYFVKYFSAKEIENDKFELIMEKLTPISEKECDMVDFIQNTLGLQEYMLDDNRRYSFIKELKQNPEYYDEFTTFNEMLTMINLLKRIYLGAEHRGIKLFDLRCENLGKTSNNNIVHFDLGAG